MDELSKQDKATDRRLFKTYGITLAEYNQWLAEQNGVCAVCGKPPTGRRLHTDHDHKVPRTKVSCAKLGGEWLASATVGIHFLEARAKTKSVAVQKVKHELRRLSCRGILCGWCNRGLRYYHDNPDFLAAAAQYLRNYHTLLGA